MKVKINELTEDLFAPYGTYFDINEGYDDSTISFLPNRMPHKIGGTDLNSLNSICIHYRALELSVTEYHDDCEEVLGGFNCDVVFHVGMLGENNKPDYDTFKVFRLKMGMYARVKRKILHHAPFVLGKDEVAKGIVILPPWTYTVDCVVLRLEKMQILL